MHVLNKFIEVLDNTQCKQFFHKVFLSFFFSQLISLSFIRKTVMTNVNVSLTGDVGHLSFTFCIFLEKNTKTFPLINSRNIFFYKRPMNVQNLSEMVELDHQVKGKRTTDGYNAEY